MAKTMKDQVHGHIREVLTNKRTKKGYMHRTHDDGFGLVIVDCKAAARADAVEAMVASGELVEWNHPESDGGDRRAVSFPRKLSFREKAELEAKGIDPDIEPDERLGLPTAKAPKAKRARKAKDADAPGNPCLCGCGETTTSPRSWFRQGHDARYAGMCKRVANGKAENGEDKRVFGPAASHPKVRESAHLAPLLDAAAKAAGTKLPKVQSW